MLSNILQNHSHTIASGLNAVGIDYNKVSHQLRYETGNTPIHGNIALNDKSSKESNPYVFVNHFNAGGNRHFSIVAKNHKGDKFIFDSFKESKGETDYSNYTPIIEAPKPKQPPKPKPLFKRALQAWNESSAANVSTHGYIVKKGVNVEGIELKRGGFAFEYDGFNYADCIMFKLIDIDGNLKGFQFINATGAKRYILEFEGNKAGAFAIVGQLSKIEQGGAIFVEGLATGLSVYHSAGDGKKTLNNAKKMPVVVCLDADNLKSVIDAFAAKFSADIINVYADNDFKGAGKGNTGLYTAFKICASHKIKSFLLPVIDGELSKVDFNDTLEFKKIKSIHDSILLSIELLKYCNEQQIERHAKNLAYALARQAPAKRNKASAMQTIKNLLERRGIEGDKLTQYQNTCESCFNWLVKKRRDSLRARNRVAVGAVQRHNSSLLSNDDIARNHKFDGAAFCDVRGYGAGKTELMALRIKAMKSAAYITHRVALVDDACHRLGLTHYHENDRYADKIGVCINSIQKFASNMRGMALFIDEARQVYETALNSPTIENRQPLMNCLIDLLNACPSLHLADADLNNDTLAFFQKHCPHLTFNLLETDVKPHTAQHFIIESDVVYTAKGKEKTISAFDVAKTAILNELNNGFKGMAGCTSEKQARYLQTFLIKNMIDPARVLLLTGANKGGDYDDNRQPAFLADIEGESKKYDLIIYTSVLGSGVSIVNESFEFTYLLNSNVLPANESMQMLARNRCAKRVYVAFDKQGNTNRVTDVETLKQGQIEKVKNFAANNGIDAETSLNDLGLMQCAAIANINLDLNDYANNFLLLAEISGRYFEHQNIVSNGQLSYQQNYYKDARDTTKETILNNILNAPVIDDIERKRLKRINATTQQQTDSIKRFEAVKMTGAGVDKLTLDDVKNFESGYSSKLNNYLLIDADTADLKQRDIDNYKAGNSQKSLLSRQKIFKAFLKPLNDANGRGIGKKDFQAACKVLKKYHLELAGEFGNYNKETFKSPAKTAMYFLEKLGYEMAETTKNNDVRLFEIFVNDDIARYATNRKGCG